jgi:hypothetical protein
MVVIGGSGTYTDKFEVIGNVKLMVSKRWYSFTIFKSKWYC